MTNWRWVGADVVYAIHDRQLCEHGGADGVRDRGAVECDESALAKPMNHLAYAKRDAADLAAAYAYGLVRNHGFVDGNKRTAWVVSRLFLADNGYRLCFEPVEAVRTMEALAAGTVDEKSFADWLRARLAPSE